VLDPTQYNGNTIVIIGCGEVKVNIQLPQTVNATDTTSK
jgi:hypothetical protein